MLAKVTTRLAPLMIDIADAQHFLVTKDTDSATARVILLVYLLNGALVQCNITKRAVFPMAQSFLTPPLQSH